MMRIAHLLAILLLTLACVRAHAQADDLAAARTAVRAGDLAGAAAAVNRHLALKPNDERGRFLKGVILSEQGRTGEAFEVFFTLTQDHPELAEPYNNIAVIYASRGEYERAREALEAAIRANPDYARAYENLGDVHARLAARAYEKALQLDAANRTARAKLALARELPDATSRRPPRRPATRRRRPKRRRGRLRPRFERPDPASRFPERSLPCTACFSHSRRRPPSFSLRWRPIPASS